MFQCSLWISLHRKLRDMRLCESETINADFEMLISSVVIFFIHLRRSPGSYVDLQCMSRRTNV